MTKLVDAFHVAEYIEEEMKARGWSSGQVAVNMQDLSDSRTSAEMQREIAVDLGTLDLTLAVREKNLLLTPEFAAKLGRAFGVSPKLFIRIDETWRKAVGE